MNQLMDQLCQEEDEKILGKIDDKQFIPIEYWDHPFPWIINRNKTMMETLIAEWADREFLRRLK